MAEVGHRSRRQERGVTQSVGGGGWGPPPRGRGGGGAVPPPPPPRWDLGMAIRGHGHRTLNSR